MKFFMLAVAVLALLWLLRSSLRGRLPTKAPPAPPEPPARPVSAQQIISCAHCGVMLPHDEALPGRGGVFCDDAHRAAFEQQHPPA